MVIMDSPNVRIYDATKKGVVMDSTASIMTFKNGS